MSGYWPEGDLGDDSDGDMDGYDGGFTSDLYDDPAIVHAMEVLKRHAITGEQYEALIKSPTPLPTDPDDDWAPFCTHCLHHHPLEQTCAEAGENL